MKFSMMFYVKIKVMTSEKVLPWEGTVHQQRHRPRYKANDILIHKPRVSTTTLDLAITLEANKLKDVIKYHEIERSNIDHYNPFPRKQKKKKQKTKSIKRQSLSNI